MKKDVTVSVLMTNYNHAKYLHDALSTILEQSRQPDEVIIIDDCSTDDSVQIIKKFREQHANLKFLQNKSNMGAIHNIKRLLNLASSKYVCFFSADDIVLPGLLEKSLLLLEKHPEAALCSSLSAQIDESGETLGIFDNPMPLRIQGYMAPDEVKKKLFKTVPWFMGNTTVYKRESLLSIGGFDEQLGSFCDGFASALISLKDGACFIPEVLAAWRKMESGYASQASINFSHSIKILNRIVELMSTTYQDIYPKRYIEKWKRNNISILYTGIAVRKYNEGINKIEERMSAEKTIFYIFSAYMIRRILKLIYYVKMLYILLRYRQPIFKIIRNKYFG